MFSEDFVVSERVGAEGLRSMLATSSYQQLFAAAAARNQQQNGDEVQFWEHRYLRVGSGDFSPVEASAQSMVDAVKRQAVEWVGENTAEIRLVSINPRNLAFETLLQVISALRDNYPTTAIRGLSAFQLVQYAIAEHSEPMPLLQQLKQAGLTNFEGRLIKPLHFQHLVQQLQNWPVFYHHLGAPFTLWLAVHRWVHLAGIASDAVVRPIDQTGTDESIHQWQAIRQLQDETGGFKSFIPASQEIAQGEENSRSRLVLEQLRIVAAARLFFDNFNSICAPWGRVGFNVAQLSLAFGANLLEGMVSDENNSRVAGASAFRSANRSEITTLVSKAGFQATEKLSLFGRALGLGQQLNEGPAVLGPDELPCMEQEGVERTLCEASTPLVWLMQKATEVKQNFMQPQQLGYLRPCGYLDVKGVQQVLQGEQQLDPLLHGEWVLDLAAAERLNLTWQNLVEVMEVISAGRSEVAIVVQGIKGLWALARQDGISLIKLAQALKDLGVVAVESSSYESENDLTSTEIISTHSTFHELDLSTIGKVEIASAYHGKGEPFWRNFAERLQLFNELQNKTHGVIGVKIEAAPDSHISPVEYLRAVALGRICLQGITNIIAPVRSFPLFHVPGLRNDPVYRRIGAHLAPVLAFCGANDLGALLDMSVNEYHQRLVKVGIAPFQRDGRYFPLRHDG